MYLYLCSHRGRSFLLVKFFPKPHHSFSFFLLALLSLLTFLIQKNSRTSVYTKFGFIYRVFQRAYWNQCQEYRHGTECDQGWTLTQVEFLMLSNFKLKSCNIIEFNKFELFRHFWLWRHSLNIGLNIGSGYVRSVIFSEKMSSLPLFFIEKSLWPLF